MSEFFESMSEKHQSWIKAQHLFFVASAPLDGNGHVNVSPKGMDTLRILTANKVAYLDVTGSGNETSGHLRENGRITFMFCAFEGAPRIMRLYGKGYTVLPGSEDWDELIPNFTMLSGARQIIVADLHSVMTSCGYAVPFFDYVEERHALNKWATHHGEENLIAYRADKNRRSIDGLVTAIGESLSEEVATTSIKL